MSSSAYKNVVMEIFSVCVWIRFIVDYIFVCARTVLYFDPVLVSF